VWLTGLPGSDRTAVTRAVAHRLRAEGRRVEVLDGEEARWRASGGGGEDEDMEAVVAGVGWVAQLLARHGIVALVPVLAPSAEDRRRVAQRHANLTTCFLEVHVDTPSAVRDAAGQAAYETYEAPTDPDIRVIAHARNAKECAAAVVELLRARGVLPGGDSPARPAGNG
jgi:adenylylsulfate kinase